MADRRPQLKHCTYRNRRRWKPATPNTSPDRWLSSARPGSMRPRRCWAELARDFDGADDTVTPRRDCQDRRLTLVAQTADHILSVIEASRSTLADVACPGRIKTTSPHHRPAAEQAMALVDLLVDEVLDRRSSHLPRRMMASRSRGVVAAGRRVVDLHRHRRHPVPHGRVRMIPCRFEPSRCRTLSAPCYRMVELRVTGCTT